MEDQSKLTFKQMLSALLRSNRRHARYIQAFACLAVLVAVAVPLVMRQYGVAMTTTETRLACQYAGNGAHTHNADCYDAYGNLVCPLPEKPFHTHSADCYATERVLTCTLPETAGHAHTEACYDEEGNLTCTLPEEPAHIHTDACYETRTTDQLICGMEETTEEHVHGPACFETVTVELSDPEPEPEPEPEPTTTAPAEPEATVPSTPEEDPTPAQEFTDVLKKKDQDGNEYVYLVVQVKASQGALPKGSAMTVAHVDLNKKDDLTGLTAQEKLDEVLRKEAGEEAAFVQTDAVDITFKDAQGNRVDPAKKVEVRITTANIRAFSDQRTANDEAVANNSLLVLHVVDHQQTKRTDAPNAELIRKAYLVNQDEKDTSTGHEDTIVFEAQEFSPYVVARVDNAAVAPEAEPVLVDQAVASEKTQVQEPVGESTEKLPELQAGVSVPDMPAQAFSHRFTDPDGNSLLAVDVFAPEGAFPRGTTMQVAWVNASQVERAVSQAVAERTDGKLRDLRAVDITFIDPSGKEIEPAEKITVTFTSDLIDTADDSYVVHLDDQGKGEVVDALGSGELQKRDIADQADELVIESDQFSTYVVAVTTLHKQLAASDGATYDIFVDAPAEAGIPQNAELRVSEVAPGTAGYEDYLSQALKVLGEDATIDNTVLARFFDIKIYSGEQEVQPQAPVRVSVKLADATGAGTTASAVHFEGGSEGTAEVLDVTQGSGTASFDATGFSVYGVIYTVDFHYDVDGQTYDYGINGGDTLSLRGLLVALGVVPAADADAFMGQVSDVTFSDPDLVAVTKVNEDTTAGELKECLNLECEYSAELTEDKIAELNAKTVEAGDWALISVRPFESDESLTVTMKNGDSFVIRVTDAQLKETVIDAKGETWEVTVTYDDDAQIPDGAKLKVEEILPADEDYQKYFEESLEKVGVSASEKDSEDENEAKGDGGTAEEDSISSNEALNTSAEQDINDSADDRSNSVATNDVDEETEYPEDSSESDYARIFNIEIWADDQKVEPASDVTVSIKLLDAPKAMNMTPQVVHFAKDGAELMELKAQDEKSEDESIQFVTDEFSVYSVVYTVDFSFSIDGKQFDFSIEGGNAITIREAIELFEIIKVEDIDSFINSIAKIEFSNPEYIWTGKVEEDTRIGELKEKNNLEVEYSSELKKGNIDAINIRPIKAPDWVLVSLKPFKSEETLTVTMKSGESFTILVTDDQSDATINPDGTVQTIANPNGTTIDLFDYWIVDQYRYTAERDAWPGHYRYPNGPMYSEFYQFDLYYPDGQYACAWDNWNFAAWHNGVYYTRNDLLRGNGNNQGINHGHNFKFTPGVGETVMDGTQGVKANDGNYGVNSWTKNASPRPGIVQGTLNAQGYPVMTNNGNLGTDDTSLNYLFDNSSQSGKQSYPGVDQLLYVDPDGYYTFNSNDFDAQFDAQNKTFTLRGQTEQVGNARGFWPFGNQVYWHGMHVQTKFSMPSNGKVLNPKGVYQDMVFEFQGDDDTWLYVDGVLVGDGGGIHNQTLIHLNFREGKVLVSGRYDVKPEYQSDYHEERYLDNLYTAAGKYGDYEWVEAKDENGNTLYHPNDPNDPRRGQPVMTFASGSNHTFDMFYLERGGGESNLYIHYNLVSTTDFTAHKSYHSNDSSRLLRDQFKFEMIGFDNSDYSGEFVQAIMPNVGTADGAGTTASPKKVHNVSAPVGLDLPSDLTAHTSLITGVTEDGNVNFGNVQVQASQNGKQYKYVVREVVPDDAVNADGVRWDEASVEVKAEGGFIKDGITYDGKVYYFIGTVQLKDGTTNEYEVKKTRYTDATYTTVDTETKFFSFVNGYVEPITLKVLKKSDTGKLLGGAEFSLTRAMKNEEDKWVVRQYQHDGELVPSTPRTGTTNSSGVLTFDNLTEGHYILEETNPPAGYEMKDTYRWLLTLTKEDAADKIVLVPTIQALDADGNLIGTATTLTPDSQNVIEHDVLNGKIPPKPITIEKLWLKVDGTTPYTLAELEAMGVHNTVITGELWRTSSGPSAHTVTFNARKDGDSNSNFTTTVTVPHGASLTYALANNSTSTQDVSRPQINSFSISPDGYDDFTEGSNRQTVILTNKNGTTWSRPNCLVYTISNITNNLTVELVYNNNSVTLDDNGIGYGTVSIDEPSSPAGPIDEKFVDFTLDKKNGWTKTWSVDELYPDDEDYTYYFKNVTENPSLEDFEFTENPEINTSGTATTYTYKNVYQKASIKIVKVKQGTSTPISGAEFTLTQVDSEKHVILDDNDQPITQVGTTAETTGELTFERLTLGAWYMLEETGVPAGYVKNEGPYYIHINEDGSGVLDTTVPHELISPDSGNEYTIENVPGAELPEAGGPGTLLHTLCGLALFAAAGYVGLASKRSARKEVA